MCEIYTQRYLERDCKMLVMLSDKCVCVCVCLWHWRCYYPGIRSEDCSISHQQWHKYRSFQSTHHSYTLFTEDTHTSCAECRLYLQAIQGLLSVYSIYTNSLVCLTRETHISHTVHTKRKYSHKHIAPCDHTPPVHFSRLHKDQTIVKLQYEESYLLTLAFIKGTLRLLVCYSDIFISCLNSEDPVI